MTEQIISSAIKYVKIETIRRNNENKDPRVSIEDLKKLLVAKSIQAGLFKGIREEQLNKIEGSKPDIFILVQTKAKTLNIFNLEHYNILSIEKFDGITKTITYFRSSEADREDALKIAYKILEELRNAGRTLPGDSRIIDVGTYTQVPAAATDDTTTDTTADTTASTYKKTVYNSTVHKPKEIVPAIIKRTTKKPTKAALEAMEAKINGITEGTFVVNLPATEGDTEEEKAVASYTTDDDNHGKTSMARYIAYHSNMSLAALEAMEAKTLEAIYERINRARKYKETIINSGGVG
jgi:hypothetical protein